MYGCNELNDVVPENFLQLIEVYNYIPFSYDKRLHIFMYQDP